MTLREIPLQRRVRAALAVLQAETGLEVSQRYDLVAAAIWPDDVATPDGGLRTTKAHPADVRAAVVAAYLEGGATYAEIGARYYLPATTVKDWVRRSRL